MAELLNKEPAIYSAERDTFLRELKVFHDQRGTPYRNVPSIEGKDVDLYKLYWLVTAHGGWEKLNSRSGWEDLVTLFGISEATSNGALFLKQIYLRYLDAYEKIHFLGEEDDEGENWYNGDEEDSRSRRQKAQKISSTVPLSYNHYQHQIPEENRAALNLATNTYQKTDYDRLILSLTSPLPNEQDFGLNVCTLLSNEGRHTLKLSKCPRLLDILLAHAGVYNHHSLMTYMNNVYGEARYYDLITFWEDVCRDKCARDLMLRYTDRVRRSSLSGSREDVPELPSSVRALAEVKLSRSAGQDEEGVLFCRSRGLGIQDLAGQRVLQIATLIRNLSFEEENAQLLARNLPCLRFCLLCCSSVSANLNQIGFDILSNVASEIVLSFGDEDCLTNVLLSTLSSSMGSNDRFQVISSLDILNKLCTQDANEEFMEEVMPDQKSVFQQLITYLSLHDIHLLISTLECLYSLSSLGENSCNAIVRTHGALEALVSLITVEAQSYGPKACILMRVVETVPGIGQHHPHPAAASHHPPAAHQAQLTTVPVTTIATIARPSTDAPDSSRALTPSAQSSTVAGTILTPSQPPQATGLTVQLASGANPNSPVIRMQPRPAAVAGATSQTGVSVVLRQQAPSMSMTPVTTAAPNLAKPLMAPQTAKPDAQQPSAVTAAPAAPVATPATTAAPAAAPAPAPAQPQQVQLRVSNDEGNRSLCLSWLRAAYETVTGASIQQEIMYKQYLASLHKLGRRDVISAPHYAACVRSIFGGSVGPHKRPLPNGLMAQFFEGVKLRNQTLPMKLPPNMSTVTTAPSAAAVSTPGSNQTPGSAATPKTASPILTNLLHRKSPGPQEATVPNSAGEASSKDAINGGGVLDGLLTSNKVPADSTTKLPSPSDNGVSSITAKEQVMQPMLNGITKINGQDDQSSLSLKRRASDDPGAASIPAKAKSHPDQDPQAMNGIVNPPLPQVNGGIERPASGLKNGSSVTNGASLPNTNGNQALDNLNTGGGQINGISSESLKAESSSSSPVPNQAASGLNSNDLSKAVPTSSPPVPPSATPVTPVIKPNPHTPFVCEWSNCMKAFKTPKEVENHAIKVHCPLGQDDIPCQWLRCDGMKRKRFSLMTHIQDRHCHPQLMKLMAVRRVQMATTGKSEVPLPPAPPPHPGYAPNAAFHAIKRHAAEFVNPKAIAMGDEKEGPVTKSIRLTSSLILKNLVIYSSLGRGRLKAFESHLSTVALSNVESSRTVSQILFEMSNTPELS